MFEITPVPLREVLDRLRPFSALVPDLWSKVSGLPTSSSHTERPFVQLAAHEMPGDEVDRLLGYAGIPASNAPIGLPLTFEPQRLGEALGADLLFPLDGLEAHLRDVAPDVLSAFEKAGSMDALVASRGESLSGREYLVGGVAECIRYCRQNVEALMIRW